ncbi:MAG: TrmH family RNA methyltransferase [Polyangiaceae bacterium]|jgi:tRNA G18 (ribose-2'-O)-methylase SpoU
MALAPPLDTPPDVVRAALEPLRNDFSIALWAPGNAFAVGAVIRIAHSFLAREVFLIGDEPFYEKATMGMHKYESIVMLANESELLRTTRGRPIWAVEKEQSRRSLWGRFTFPAGVVFVFGSERFGIPPEVLATADEIMGLPIFGVNHSLPLAVAAGIVMNEWARRHYLPGRVL